MHFREYNLNASSYSLTMESSKEHQYFNVCFHVENDNIGANGVTKLCITKTPLANLHKEGNKAAKVLGITENTQGYLMKCTVTESLKTSTSSKNQTKKVFCRKHSIPAYITLNYCRSTFSARY